MPGKRMLLAFALLIASAVSLGACNTTQGFGQDMTSAGHAISNSAEKNK